MTHINTYEEDLEKVTSQIKELQAKQANLIQTMLENEANKLVGNICNKIYRHKVSDYLVIFHKVTDCVNPGFNYYGYSIKSNEGCGYFAIYDHREVFESENDFNSKYEPVVLNTSSVLFDLVDTFKNVNYETSAND